MHPGAITGICVAGYVVLAVLGVQVLPFSGWSKQSRQRKRRIKFSVARAAHRGGSLNGPENTLWAFQRTAEDCDVLELDVALTADGAVVVTHDHELSRQCGTAEGTRIDHFDHAQLPKLQRDIPLHFTSVEKDTYSLSADLEQAATYGLCTEEQPFCLLRQVFETFPRKPIHLDMKYTSAELVHKVFDLVDEFDRRQLTILGCASGPNVATMRSEIKRRERLNSSTKGKYLTFASFPEVVRTYLLFYAGLLPLIPLAYDSFSIPIITKEKEKYLLKARFGNSVLRAIAIAMLRSPSLWRHLRRRGIVVIGWVLNDPVEWDEVRHFPIDGIMTDDPIKLNRHLHLCWPTDKHHPRCSCSRGHDAVPLDSPHLKPRGSRNGNTSTSTAAGSYQQEGEGKERPADSEPIPLNPTEDDGTPLVKDGGQREFSDYARGLSLTA